MKLIENNISQTEYKVYSREGVFFSYLLAYAVTQKNYIIYNQLGSKSVEEDSVGNFNGYVLYTPYGEPLETELEPQTKGYIGKEKDKENNLGDHGVRKYDSQIGRFTSTEPLYEKYFGWINYPQGDSKINNYFGCQ